MIDLYFWPTGNGKKSVILLEELGLPYTIKPINIGRGDQLTPQFLRISPTAGCRRSSMTSRWRRRPDLDLRIRADHDVSRREDRRFWPQDTRGKYDVSCGWVGSWPIRARSSVSRAISAVPPRPATTAISPMLRRFDNEAHRIYGVMNLGLFNKRYLAAGQYTIADMICYPWASSWSSRKIDIDEFPNVKSWLAEIGERPAVKGHGDGAGVPRGPGFDQPGRAGPPPQARRPTSAPRQSRRNGCRRPNSRHSVGASRLTRSAPRLRAGTGQTRSRAGVAPERGRAARRRVPHSSRSARSGRRR